MEAIKQRARSKTYRLAIAVSALGAVQMALPGVADLLKEHYGPVTMAVGVLIAVLREMTKDALSDK